VAFYVIHMVAPLYNHVMWLVLQSDFFNYALTYIAFCVCINIYGRMCTSKQIVNYVSHLNSIKNMLSHFMSLVTGEIIVNNTR